MNLIPDLSIECRIVTQYIARLAEQFTLTENAYRTGGPARYVTVEETGGRLGLNGLLCKAPSQLPVTEMGLDFPNPVGLAAGGCRCRLGRLAGGA